MNYLNYLKNKKVLALLGVVLVLFVAGVAFLLLRHNSQTAVSGTPEAIVEESFPSLSPEEIGMKVTVRSDKRAVMFELTKAQNIKHVDYEIRYSHLVEGEKISEGLLGEMNIAEDGITKTDFRPFGTCSSGVCRYDQDVSDVLIVMKVQTKDGKTYQVQQPVSL